MNVFEGNVVVRITDVGGAQLAQEPTTADESGNWSVTLAVGAVDTTATIHAYATSPEDGSVVAEATATVEFVTTPPVQAEIVITSPEDGAVVNTDASFAVTGTANGLIENNVVVRVRDGSGRTLLQQATTTDPAGGWAVSLTMLVRNNTPGNIYAFSISPADGRVIGEGTVNVTFASSCDVRTGWDAYTVQAGDNLFKIAQRFGTTVSELTLANCLTTPNLIFSGQQIRVPPQPGGVIQPDATVTITSPEADAALDLTGPVRVTGESAGTLEGTVFVRAMDSAGVVLDEARASVVESTAESWTWEVELALTTAAPGARGVLFAYAVSAEGAGLAASDAVSILFGADDESPYVTITSPMPYATLSLEGGVVVEGRGRGLFEGNVVVQAVDSNGNVLAQAPTTIDAPDAGTGGAGGWQITLPVTETRRGKIIAFSTSARDGSVVTSAAVDVIFGDPTQNPSYVLLSVPLPNTVVTNATPYLPVAGYAGGVSGYSLFVQVLDEAETPLVLLPVIAEPGTGLWSTVVTLGEGFNIEEARALFLQIIATTPSGGVAAADKVPIYTRPGGAVISGTLTYRERIALPPDAVINVQLRDVSRADAPAVALGEQTLTNYPGQAPIPFAIAYNPDVIAESGSYVIHASITDGAGNLLFITTERFCVLTQGCPTDNVEVMLQGVAG
ncbi:MAG: YbaY family lipoprotein [Anaerolineae bacterium]|nr:YbaY family lipoprotein [Anaerolineae bacterium]